MSKLTLDSRTKVSDVRTDLALTINTIFDDERYDQKEMVLLITAVWGIAMRARDLGTRDECNKLFADTLEKVMTHHVLMSKESE